MKMCVVGTGYVGLVAGACFSESGNHVICVDNDESKIRRLKKGEIPIYEPGLAEIVHRNAKAGRLAFATDLAAAVKNSRVIFIAVGTPPATDGSADLSSILSVAETIGRSMDGYRIVVMKSTVPVGTHRKVSEVIGAQTDHPFDYVSNPEFLKEGAAIEDFTKPDRVVIGATNHAVVEIMKELYGPFMRRSERILAMDPASAEMTKYAANALLATKISFMNEVAGLCERFGADVENVRHGVGSDSRIGDAFLFPGVGYGGSCFPKDVSAVVSMGEEVNHPMSIVAAVQEVNRRQRRMFADRIIDHFGDRCSRTTLAVWGLAFKAQTDDVRESPALDIMTLLEQGGANVHYYDEFVEKIKWNDTVKSSEKELSDKMLSGYDAVVVVTDHSNIDYKFVLNNSNLIVDTRNVFKGFKDSKIIRLGADQNP